MDGWLNIDKPLNISSAGVVGAIKKIVGKGIKIGHCGTLDPLADGVLPIALGQATKLSDYVMGSNKTYVFTIQFGRQTTTGDAEGQIMQTTDVVPEKLEHLQEVTKYFTGTITQEVPKYSAVKISGVPSYKLARQGVEVPIKIRDINILSLTLLSADLDKHTATYEVLCSKGTYVRSLAQDIALSLKSLGFVVRLTRTSMKNFSSVDSLALSSLSCDPGLALEQIKNALLPLEHGLIGMPFLDVAAEQALDIKHGKKVLINNEDLDLVWLRHNGRLLTIGNLFNKEYNIIRNFNLEN